MIYTLLVLNDLIYINYSLDCLNQPSINMFRIDFTPLLLSTENCIGYIILRLEEYLNLN